MKPISGTFQYSDGTPVAGGSVWMKLPQDAVVLGTAQIAPQWVRKILDNTGSLPANTLVVFTDELSPSGLTYTVSVVAPGGGLVWGAESIPITGASFNLNTAVPTTLNILLANPVITNPTSIQTINSFALADTIGFQAGVGSVSTPSYTFIGDTNTGMYDAGADDIRFSVNGTDSFRIDGTSPTVPSGRPLAWGSAGVTSRDAGFSRLASGTIGIGNGTQGSISGQFVCNTLSASNVQQVSAVTAFSILDNLGVSHFFISGTSPFTNTFIQGNGSGSTFIGTGSFAVSIPDASNLIQFKGLTSGTVNLVAAAIAGSTILTMPAAGTDTLVTAAFAQTLSSKTLVSPVVTTGVANTGNGLQHKRVTTGSIAGGARADVTLSWTTAFADTSYTVVCSVQEATAAPGLSLRVEHIDQVNTGSIRVSIVNDNAGALTGTLHAIAMHD